ncbi:MAG: sulfotransferase [Myxococcales bacterium]|nr:sulfotransferase [Myxococcales bacterium]
MPKQARLPWYLEAVNFVADPIRRTAYPLDADRMMSTARRKTGLDDFGDDDGFEARFRAQVASLNRVDWSFSGRAGVRVNLLWTLNNRLRVIHALRQAPDVPDLELHAPVIILGLFRTGSTFLHQVMASDPRLRAGWMWEFGYPAGRRHDPLGDVAWRRAQCAWTLKLVDIMIPDQDEVHSVDAEQLEEDFFLLENDFSSMKFVVGFGDRQLGWDLLDADLLPSYRFHRTQLKLLSRTAPDKRWLLKCPWHMWNLDTVLEVYPDALFIQTHRDPETAIASQASLSARISARMKREEQLHEVGRFWVDYSKAGIERGLAARERIPADRIIDVRLSDLRADGERTLRGVYEHLGLPLDEHALAAMTHAAQTMPTMQHGTHDYDISDFGLDAEGVRRELADYCERFGV